MYILLVEDAKERVRWFKSEFYGCDIVVEKRPGRACRFVREKKFDLIFLDHDLGIQASGGDELDSMEVAKAIPGSVNRNTTVIIHSINPVGSENLRVFLSRNGVNVHRIVYGTFNRSIILNR